MLRSNCPNCLENILAQCSSSLDEDTSVGFRLRCAIRLIVLVINSHITIITISPSEAPMPSPQACLRALPRVSIPRSIILNVAPTPIANVEPLSGQHCRSPQNIRYMKSLRSLTTQQRIKSSARTHHMPTTIKAICKLFAIHYCAIEGKAFRSPTMRGQA